MAAGIYLLICLFDFIIMPIYTATMNSKLENVIISKLETKDFATYANEVIKSVSANKQWNPLTLLGGGMFHLAFGSLLTGGAVTRGFAKKSEVEGYYKYGSIPDNSDPSTQRRNNQQTYSGPQHKADNFDDIK